MSIVVDHGPDEGGDDLLAAEYVLGVLPAEDRTFVARRIDAEAAFARSVERWEGHFVPMADAYAAVDPPASVKIALDRRLFSSTATEVPDRSGLWSSLAFWRGLTAVAVAAALAFAVVEYAAPPAEPQARLVASLAADGSDVRYLALYDPASGEVSLSHVSGERGAGKDFELWMIEGGNAPVSMGIVPSGEAAQLPVSEAARQKLAQGAVLAVSLEPAGGSPTGQPTGPVVAAGDLRGI
jgi:anti-sigma-K factor RskA